MNLIKVFALTAIVILVTACGGGGGENSPLGFSLTTSNKILIKSNKDDDDFIAAAQVAGKISKTVDMIYIDHSDSDLIEDINFDYFPDTNEVKIYFLASPWMAIGEGIHEENFNIKICEDSLCKKELVGSPINIEVEYQIGSGDNFNLSVFTGSRGNITASNNFFECDEEFCERKIYGSAGDYIELTAHALPGYQFDKWSGDCSGSKNCVLPFSVNGNASVSAEFIERPSSDGVCDAAFFPESVKEGVVDIGKASLFSPLCKGLVLVSYANSQNIDLIQVSDSTHVVKSYQVDSYPYAMSVNYEKKILYVSHTYVKYISRIDLDSGNVSKIFIPRSSENNSVIGKEELVVANNGYLFALSNVPYKSTGTAYTLWLMDGVTGLRKKRFPFEVFANKSVFEYAKMGNYLFSHDMLYMYYYFFDENTLSLTKKGEIAYTHSGWDCNPGDMSIDGLVAAFPCRGKNETAERVVGNDFVGGNVINGYWQTGEIKKIDFSPMNNYLAVASTNLPLEIFSTTTYQSLYKYTGSPIKCNSEIYSARKLDFSPDEKMVFSFYACSDSEESTTIAWMYIN